MNDVRPNRAFFSQNDRWGAFRVDRMLNFFEYVSFVHAAGFVHAMYELFWPCEDKEILDRNGNLIGKNRSAF